MACNIDMIPGVHPDKERTMRCCLCGYWIKQDEYGSAFNGQFVNFIDKQVGNIVMTFCTECTRKIMEFTDDSD